MLLECNSALDEANILHGRGIGGAVSDGLFFSIFRKTDAGGTSQRSYRLHRLDEIIPALDSTPDAYISQSSFWKFGRTMAGFKQVRACWVDLDIYNLGLEYSDDLLARLMEHGDALQIARPTQVIESGRGIYLKWVFESHVGSAELPVWQALQRALTALYTSFAADVRARDASRVFRILGSIHRGAGRRVAMAGGTQMSVRFSDMCSSVECAAAALVLGEGEGEVMEVSHSTRKMIDKLASGARTAGKSTTPGDVSFLATYSAMRQPIMLGVKKTPRSLNWARFCDLRDLFIARGGIGEGTRDISMLWMTTMLAKSGVVDHSNWKGEVTSLMRAFDQGAGFNPVEDGSLQTLLRRVKDSLRGVKYSYKGREYDPIYNASNEYLIDTFEISSDEQKSLSTIIDSSERLRRSDAKCDGRAKRREHRQGWRDQITLKVDTIANGLPVCEDLHRAALIRREINVAQIAREVNAPRVQVNRYLNSLLLNLEKKAQTIQVSTQDTETPCFMNRDGTLADQSLADQSLADHAQQGGLLPEAPPKPPALPASVFRGQLVSDQEGVQISGEVERLRLEAAAQRARREAIERAQCLKAIADVQTRRSDWARSAIERHVASPASAPDDDAAKRDETSVELETPPSKTASSEEMAVSNAINPIVTSLGFARSDPELLVKLQLIRAPPGVLP